MYVVDHHPEPKQAATATATLRHRSASPSARGPATTLREVATILGLPLAGNGTVGQDLVLQQRLYKAGEAIYRAGAPFDALYVVHAGVLRCSRVDEAGNEQVLSFPMRGDLIGVDGISEQIYRTDAVALHTSNVIVVPFQQLRARALEEPEIDRLMLRAISRELVRDHEVLSIVGTLGAEARLAHFLLRLSERYAALGYSRRDLTLHMTRQEIGSYLGCSLETISRTLSAWATRGILTVHNRSIEIRDFDALSALRLGGSRARTRPAAVA